jgi:hypothetical protein
LLRFHTKTTHDADSPFWDDLLEYRELCEVVAIRKIKQAIPLLLERACCGDPGEVMRGLPDYLWATASPDLDFLVGTYLTSTRSFWAGARLYSIDGLGQLRRFHSGEFDSSKVPTIDSALEIALTDSDRIIRMRASTWMYRMR